MDTTRISYNMDMNTIYAVREIVIDEWELDRIDATNIDSIIDVSGKEVIDYFFDYLDAFGDARCRVFRNSEVLIWSDSGKLLVQFDEVDSSTRIDTTFFITGNVGGVLSLKEDFNKTFAGKFVPKHHNVEWVTLSPHGLETTNAPIKTRQTIVDEMYPIITSGVDNFVDGFLNSSANVLILTGPPGLGKSALLNHIVMRGERRTQVVYDPDVMKSDQLYASFIIKSFRDNGAIMIMEDADLILTDRTISQNETMSKILNVSDGIIDTSSAKFIFTANINNVSDIDEALTRPGRCYDIVNFRALTRSEAEKAATAIGKDLVSDKDEYTVAEIYNSRDDDVNRRKIRKMGF